MKKINKLFYLIIFIIAAYSCGYEPVMNFKKYPFYINELNITGNKRTNSNIKDNLKFMLVKKKNSVDYNLQIVTKSEKIVISNDSRGDPLLFELIISAEVKIFKNEKLILNRKIIQKNSYNNKTDKLELEKYEYIVNKTLSKNISNQIIFIMSNLKENDN